MSLKNDAFPASAAFDLINSSLQANEADRKDAIKKGGAIFAFTLKNKGQEESWYIDLKEKGVVGKGAAPPGGKANDTTILQSLARIITSSTKPVRASLMLRLSNEQYYLVTLVLSDDDFSKLISGTANAQKLFMSGKLKVRGDVMKATKMEPILKKAQNNAKL
ncbi:MAG: hypothetical protein M1821_001173 [Bathelium mastoideum]|nr:MAG: hypothetical protein M1821_001173 [Bathelium mastoideum]